MQLNFAQTGEISVGVWMDSDRAFFYCLNFLIIQGPSELSVRYIDNIFSIKLAWKNRTTLELDNFLVICVILEVTAREICQSIYFFLMVKFYLFSRCLGMSFWDIMLSFSSVDIPPSSDHAFPDWYIVTTNLIVLLLLCYLDWIQFVWPTFWCFMFSISFVQVDDWQNLCKSARSSQLFKKLWCGCCTGRCQICRTAYAGC